MNDPWHWRTGVMLGGTSFLAVFAVLYHDAPASYHAILVAWGVVPYRFPFLDTHAVLSALDCARQGIDPYVANPCNVLTEAFNYSPLILEAASLPVTRGSNGTVGIALALMFFVAVASLPAPRGGRERIVTTLAVMSTMTAFAIERGNIDLLAFSLIAAAGHALRGGFATRTGGYALIVLAALLKFYPLVALVTALRETPRRLAAVAVGVLAVAAVFAVYYRHGLSEALALVPFGSYFTDLFGATNLPWGLAELLRPLGATPFLSALPWLVGAALVASCVSQALAVARLDRVAAPRDTEEIFLFIGTVLIVGCFFAGQNIDYRGIFFLFVLPGLLALARAGGAPRIFFRTAILIVFLMWGELFREALQHIAPTNADPIWQTVKASFWLLRELVWWRVIGVLLGLLIGLVARAPLLERIVPPRWRAA